MSGKVIFIVGVLGIAGYVGKNMANHDPNAFALSRAQVEAKLVRAETKLPRRDGPGEIRIWGTGTSAKGVTLNMRYSDDSPLLECEAIITAVSETESRVTSDCGGTDTGSAIGNTTAQLRAPMFDEHIHATLEGRAFERALVDQKESAVVMKNLGGMQREALRASDEMQRLEAENTR